MVVAASLVTAALFGSILVTLKTPGGGKVIVKIDQHGAEVVLDDKPIGTTTEENKVIEARVSEGEHKLEVKKVGFETEKREIVCRKGEVSTVPVTMKPVVVLNPMLLPEGFVSLFNGKDLDGWYHECDTAGKFVVEGVVAPLGRF